MIPFDELIRALERYQRQKQGLPVPAEEPRDVRAADLARGRMNVVEVSAEINLDDMEAE